MTPSSAATTMRYRSIPVAPATIVRTKRSWPGTSTTETRRPPGSTSGAKPSSIDMPRACSSGRRSVSTPVSARTSAVLPWSMWPAVPSVRAACAFAAVIAIRVDRSIGIGDLGEAAIERDELGTDDQRSCE